MGKKESAGTMTYRMGQLSGDDEVGGHLNRTVAYRVGSALFLVL